MKTFIKKLMQTALVGTFLFTGALFADASFVNDPSTQGNGVTSIGNGIYDANDFNSIQANIPNAGDSKEFYVFIDYQNAANYTLEGVRAFLSYSGTNQVTFTGRLSSTNGGSVTDTASLTGLPSNYEISFISASKINTHGTICGALYEYNVPVSGLTSPNGALIGSLDTYGTSTTNGYTGMCSQGHVVARLRVTNTTTITPNPTTITVQTLAPSNVTSSGARLNGKLSSGNTANHYWFVYSSSSTSPQCALVPSHPNPSATSVDSGTNPSYSVTQSGLNNNTTYYYRACVTINGEVYGAPNVEQFRTTSSGIGTDTTLPEADTQTESNVDENSATLKGRIRMNTINNGKVFFVYGEDQSKISSTTPDYDSYDEVLNNLDGNDFRAVSVNNDLDEDGWTSFSREVGNLRTDRMHYFQICVEYQHSGDNLRCGGVESFRTVDDDSGNNDDVEIETRPYEDVGTTSARLCGDLEENGGDSSLRTNIEYREASGGSWIRTSYRERGEGSYCDSVNRLEPNTRYQYRACTDEGDCGDIRTFITNGGGQVFPLNVNTLAPTNIGTTSAVLNGAYQGSSLESTKLWFEWGRTQSLGTRKQTFTRTASAGNFSDSFTGLQSCSTYYYRAVAQNSTGIKYGNTYQFTTNCTSNSGGTTIVRPPAQQVVVVEQVEEEVIDLDRLGLGLSLLRLDIDNNQTTVYRDAVVEYIVRWENISQIDLDTIDIKVSVPKEISVTSTSAGRYDSDSNVIFYTIDRLNRGEQGSFSFRGIANNGKLGALVNAEATAAYNNPINDAQENATDYDTDEYVVNTNLGTASVFGLSNITFLGWLTILLGLFIIFLIARGLYLEREELRAQAYAQGYRPVITQDPRYLGGVEPRYDQSNDDHYQPYRPNRG